MPRRLPTLALLAAGLWAAAHSASARAQDELLLDRVVAVVDEDPILLSDLERAISLGLVERRATESDGAFRRRALDELVAQRLRRHELDRFGFESLPVEQIERQLASVRARFASDAELDAELARLGLDRDGLRQLLAAQLATLVFVEERLGPRIFVGSEEIRRYYDDTLLPELARAGAPVPPIEQVREQIRDVLTAAKMNEEIGRWTEELRREADVIDLLDGPQRPLPPLVERLPRRPGG